MGCKQYHHVLGDIFSENKAKYESNIEDERKLFYVAVTRAKQNLFLNYTLEKSAGFGVYIQCRGIFSLADQ